MHLAGLPPMTTYSACRNPGCRSFGVPTPRREPCNVCGHRLGPELDADVDLSERRTGLTMTGRPTPGRATSETANSRRSAEATRTNRIWLDSGWAIVAELVGGVVLLLLGVYDRVHWHPLASSCDYANSFGQTSSDCAVPQIMSPLAPFLLVIGVLLLLVGGTSLVLWVRNRR